MIHQLATSNQNISETCSVTVQFAKTCHSMNDIVLYKPCKFVRSPCSYYSRHGVKSCINGKVPLTGYLLSVSRKSTVSSLIKYVDRRTDMHIQFVKNNENYFLAKMFANNYLSPSHKHLIPSLLEGEKNAFVKILKI